MKRAITSFFKEIYTLVRETAQAWIKDKISIHAAALAFYTTFSVAPLIIIMIAVTGFLFGEQAASGQLADYLESIFGKELAETLQNFVLSAYDPVSGLIATVISIGIIMFSSTTVIAQLKDSLNTIWGVEVKEEEGGIKRFVINRALSFALILIFTVIFIASIIIHAAFDILEPFLDPLIPGGVGVWSVINSSIFFVNTTLLFAIIFKMLPDINVRWRDVMVGAMVTTLLFLFGRYVTSLYLLSGDITSTIGAAGSFVVFLVWVYYNTLVIFLGAEFTKVYTKKFGEYEAMRFARLADDYQSMDVE